VTTTYKRIDADANLRDWADYARADVDEAISDVMRARDWAESGVHKAQLETALKGLEAAKAALRWVRP
jgi:hypothetical protein